MAAPADFDEVLTNVGFNAFTRGILVDADMENLNLVALYTWSDENVDDLVRTLRKIPPNAIGTAPYVPVRAIDRMKTVTYICRHMIRTQRVPTIDFFTSVRINVWTQERKSEADYKEPDEPPKLSKSDNATILEFIEDFPEELARFTGLGGRPLAYVIRDLEPVLPEADDPIFGEPGSQYISVRDEIISRAALMGTAFQADNKRVFEILRDAISEFEPVKVWLKGHTRSKDGRAAWRSFTAHYLGSAQLDTIANRADIKIETLVYIGEKQRYSFETHVSNFKQAHLDLKKAGNEPDGRTKVRKFLQSIKAPEMQTAVAAAQTQDAYLTDFEATINYLRRFVAPASNTRTVAMTSTSQVSGDKSAPTKPPGLTYRWYKKDEFRALPEDHQEWLRYEKRRRDKEATAALKGDKRKVKNLIRKEKRKLAKLKAASKESKKVDERDNSGNESS